jgi:hypothetical protein
MGLAPRKQRPCIGRARARVVRKPRPAPVADHSTSVSPSAIHTRDPGASRGNRHRTRFALRAVDWIDGRYPPLTCSAGVACLRATCVPGCKPRVGTRPANVCASGQGRRQTRSRSSTTAGTQLVMMLVVSRAGSHAVHKPHKAPCPPTPTGPALGRPRRKTCGDLVSLQGDSGLGQDGGGLAADGTAGVRRRAAAPGHATHLRVVRLRK